MDDKFEKKLEFKDKLLSFYNDNKLKVIVFFITIVILISIILIKTESQRRNNIMLSDKFNESVLLISVGEIDKAKIILDEIILKKNKFYSFSALNLVIDKELMKKEKVLDYFKIIEQLNLSEETYDLIQLKKALYIIENFNKNSGIEILNKLIKENSNLKSIAEEIIKE